MNSAVRDNFNETGVAKSTAAGDMTYGTAANALARIAVGTTGQILMLNAANTPSWQAGLPKSGYFLGARAVDRRIDGSIGTVTTSGNSVSFVSAFSATPNVVAGLNSSTPMADAISVYAITTTGFGWICPQSAAATWLAFGSDT